MSMAGFIANVIIVPVSYLGYYVSPELKKITCSNYHYLRREIRIKDENNSIIGTIVGSSVAKSKNCNQGIHSRIRWCK